MRDALDTKFGVLNSAQDGKIVAYDSSTNKFVLETGDAILTELYQIMIFQMILFAHLKLK